MANRQMTPQRPVTLPDRPDYGGVSVPKPGPQIDKPIPPSIPPGVPPIIKR